MSFDNNKEKCAVCNAYLFQEDDIVYCPECGAPHHRDCYNTVGHCGLAEYHGTDKEYKKPEPSINKIDTNTSDTDYNEIICQMCGEKYDKTEMICPKCGGPNLEKTGGRFVSFDFSGGVSDDADLGDGVTARDAKIFVNLNSHRYIPKFLSFKNGKKTSWNWLAFLAPCGWLLSRKMYLIGALIGALQVAISMLAIPLTAAIGQLDISQANNYMEISKIIVDNISIIGMASIYTASIGAFLDLLLRIVFAIFGDLIYKNKVIASVNDIKRKSEDKILTMRKKGGVNFLVGVLGYFVVNELPTIIAYMLGLL